MLFEVGFKLLLGVIALPVIVITKVLLGQLYLMYKYRSSGCNIPAAMERPFWGSIDMAGQGSHNLAKELGPIFYSTMLDTPHITIGDADLAHYVLLKENLPKSTVVKVLQVLWGESIFTLQHGEDQPWKDHRHLVNPAFKFSSIRALHPIFAENSISMAEKLGQYAKSNEVFNFAADVSLLTLDIISSSGFGYKLGALRSRGHSDFYEALNKVINSVKSPLCFMGLSSLVFNWNLAQVKIVNDLFYGIIDDRIKQLSEGKGRAGAPRDILDILLEPNEDGRQLSKEQIRNELLAFYFAGHETTATLLSWAIYRLPQHPDIEEKLVQEIESVMGPHKGTFEAPTIGQLEELTYMTMFLNELLRLYPPATSILRENPETFEFKGLIFPKGIELNVSPLVIHHNPAYWADPEKFDPERFSKEQSEGRHLCAFLPFSAGQRICVGRNFFYNEAKTILATMLRAFTFRLDPSRESGKIARELTLRPNAVWVTVEERKK